MVYMYSLKLHNERASILTVKKKLIVLGVFWYMQAIEQTNYVAPEVLK